MMKMLFNPLKLKTTSLNDPVVLVITCVKFNPVVIERVTLAVYNKIITQQHSNSCIHS